MNKHAQNQLRQIMSQYLRQGATAYRKKQFKRLCNIIEDINRSEPEIKYRLSAIGKKQIIGYWRRTKDETDKTKLEKWRVLSKLFNELEKPQPPKPYLNE